MNFYAQTLIDIILVLDSLLVLFLMVLWGIDTRRAAIEQKERLF